MNKILLYSKLFWNLFKTDLTIYVKEILWGELIDSFTLSTCIILIATYILPEIGLSKSYGSFMAVGMIVSMAFWDVWSITTKFISDLEGNKTFTYYLSLPLPAWLYFLKQITFHAVRGGTIAIFMLPLGKLILLNRINFTNFNLVKFICAFISTCIFCATLSLIMGAIVKDMNNIGHVAIRFLFPMWFLGGSQYSWYTLLGFSKNFAYLCLLNPLLYSMEAMHVATLGQEGYLPFWSSLFILWIFIILSSWYGITKMKKRLDCV